jgi:hypothetical protein
MPAFQKGARLSSAKLKRKKFLLPELGDDCFIFLRTLTAKEIFGWQAKEDAIRKQVVADAEVRGETLTDKEIVKRVSDYKELDGFVLIAIAAVDETGQQIFAEEKDAEGRVIKTAAQDAKDNLDIGFNTLLAMVREIYEISGMDAEQREKN